MNIDFDFSKDFTIADLAKASSRTEEQVVRTLWEEGCIEFDGGVTEFGRSKIPGLRFPKWKSSQYGHWDAEHWYVSHQWTSANIALRYGLKRNMGDNDWSVALRRAGRDAEEWGVVLHGKQRFFEKVLNRGFEYRSLGNMEWVTLTKAHEKWTIPEWVVKLRATGNPWLLFLSREDIEKDIVILDAEQFQELLKKIPS